MYKNIINLRRACLFKEKDLRTSSVGETWCEAMDKCDITKHHLKLFTSAWSSETIDYTICMMF